MLIENRITMPMTPSPDMSGQKFGCLTVLGPARSGSRSEWACLCECGRERDVRWVYLRNGKFKKCACVAPTSGPKKTLSNVLKEYKKAAKRRGMSWGLTSDEAYALFASSCFFCNAPPANRSWYLTYSGIDRLDNSLGYIRGNVVACCKQCNFAKRTLSVADFLAWANRVVVTSSTRHDSSGATDSTGPSVRWE